MVGGRRKRRIGFGQTGLSQKLFQFMSCLNKSIVHIRNDRVPIIFLVFSFCVDFSLETKDTNAIIVRPLISQPRSGSKMLLENVKDKESAKEIFDVYEISVLIFGRLTRLAGVDRR